MLFILACRSKATITTINRLHGRLLSLACILHQQLTYHRKYSGHSFRRLFLARPRSHSFPHYSGGRATSERGSYRIAWSHSELAHQFLCQRCLLACRSAGRATSYLYWLRYYSRCSYDACEHGVSVICARYSEGRCGRGIDSDTVREVAMSLLNSVP